MKKLFSLIALVGMIAACTPEQVETAFKLSGGKVIVEVEVVDIINGGAYTGTYTVNSTFGTVSGNKITYQADDSLPVTAGTYQVTVTGPKLKDEGYTSSFAVPAVLAGGEAIISVIVPVGEPLNGWTITPKEGTAVVNEPTVKYLVATHYAPHDYSHDGINTWYVNNTEFLLEGNVNYEKESYAVGHDLDDKNILGFEGKVTEFYQNMIAADKKEPVKDTYHFTVDAYAMWNLTQKVTSVTMPYTVIAEKGTDTQTLGSFKIERINGQVIERHVIAYPGAEAHYHAGHGHDAHGTMPNAGGGMAINF